MNTTAAQALVSRRQSLVFQLERKIKALDPDHPMYQDRRNYLLRLVAQLTLDKTQGLSSRSSS